MDGRTVRLTESLAALLLLATRQHFEEQFAIQESEVSRKAEELRLEREQLADIGSRLQMRFRSRLAA